MKTATEIKEMYKASDCGTGYIKDVIKKDCNGYDESYDDSLFIGYMDGFAVVINCGNLKILEEAAQ